VKVWIPSPLFSYTGRRPEVEASGATIDEVLRDLDRQFPGFRFRVVDEQDRLRKHMRIFVNREETRRLETPLAGHEEIHIFQALSGG
jgi:molybdopterin converting factor small subunit